MSSAEIVDRVVLAMVNEAARCLEEGAVEGPAQLDLATVFGTGFAPFRGGVLSYADARGLERQVGAGDRRKLDSYFTSVRELEQRLAASEAWALKPKPQVAAKQPPVGVGSDNLALRKRAMLDIMALALETDSTRFLTFHLDGANKVLPIDPVPQRQGPPFALAGILGPCSTTAKEVIPCLAECAPS